MRFGPFSLEAGALSRDGKVLAIGQRGLALLEALAGVDGAVSKDALIEAAWPGVTVEEGNLTVQIAALRKALGPRDDGQEWIVTVPRVGVTGCCAARRLSRQAASASCPRWPCCRSRT